MLEVSNRPRSIKITMRGADGTLQGVAQIRKDNLEYQGEVSTVIDADERAELEAIVETMRQSQSKMKESVLTRLVDVLSEATTRFAETNDEMERRLIRQFIDNAFRQLRRSSTPA